MFKKKKEEVLEEVVVVEQPAQENPIVKINNIVSEEVVETSQETEVSE